MIIGFIDSFALDYKINTYYKSKSLYGLGYYNIYINNIRYGIKEDDGAILATAYLDVLNRIAKKGLHKSNVFFNANENQLASEIIEHIYNEPKAQYLGLTFDQFSDVLYKDQLLWIPDGEENFDDGSHIIQIDHEDKVKLIAFKYGNNLGLCNDLTSTVISLNKYYSILEEFAKDFELNWLKNNTYENV